jgi:trk system potassium uptake protein TrkA
VDSNSAAFDRLGASFKGRKVEGIGFDHDVLLQAGIERADGLAAVTSSDETNVVAAQVARQMFHVPRVVARLYDVRQAEIYARLGLQTIAPTSWGIGRIADLLVYSQLDTFFTLGNGEVELVQAAVPPLLVGRAVDALSMPGDVSVIAITRKSKAFLPTLATLFEAGDLLHLAVVNTATSRLNDLLTIA